MIKHKRNCYKPRGKKEKNQFKEKQTYHREKRSNQNKKNKKPMKTNGKLVSDLGEKKNKKKLYLVGCGL